MDFRNPLHPVVLLDLPLYVGWDLHHLQLSVGSVSGLAQFLDDSDKVGIVPPQEDGPPGQLLRGGAVRRA